MHPLKRLVLGLLLLGVMLVAVAFALPQHITVARSQVINAPESDVFPFVNNLKRYNEWQPWLMKEPGMDIKYTELLQGVGAKMNWNSQEFGSGSHEIVEAQENSQVRVKLDFGEAGDGEATYRLEPYGAGTRVVWVFDTDVGNNPLQRWMGLMFDRWIGKDFETGLASLKKVAEAAR